MARIFEGPRHFARHFHTYPNILTVPGDELTLHEHEQGHLAVFENGNWEVDAIVNGKEIVVSLDAFGSGNMQVAYIAAKTPHRIRWLGGADVGRFCCIFSHYDQNGLWQPDPKRKPETDG